MCWSEGTKNLMEGRNGAWHGVVCLTSMLHHLIVVMATADCDSYQASRTMMIGKKVMMKPENHWKYPQG